VVSTPLRCAQLRDTPSTLPEPLRGSPRATPALSKLKQLVSRRFAPSNKLLEATPRLTLRKQVCYKSIAPRLSAGVQKVKMENLTEWLTIISLMLTTAALGFSAYQIRQNRQALLKNEKSLALSTHVRQLETLGRMHYVISLQVKLEDWIQKLSVDHKKLSSGIRKHDPNEIIPISDQGLSTPKHLVERHFADNAPDWAVELMFCGASYFYNSKSTYEYLWKKKTNEVNFSYAIDVQDRIEESIEGLKELKLLIENALPAAVLNCPASMSNDRYLGD